MAFDTVSTSARLSCEDERRKLGPSEGSRQRLSKTLSFKRCEILSCQTHRSTTLCLSISTWAASRLAGKVLPSRTEGSPSKAWTTRCPLLRFGCHGRRIPKQHLHQPNTAERNPRLDPIRKPCRPSRGQNPGRRHFRMGNT